MSSQAHLVVVSLDDDEDDIEGLHATWPLRTREKREPA